jgi:hypothetical protein
MQRPHGVAAHHRSLRRPRPRACPHKVKVYERIQFRLQLRHSSEVRVHNLDWRKFPIANPRSNFRNRSKNYFIHGRQSRVCVRGRGVKRDGIVDSRQLKLKSYKVKEQKGKKDNDRGPLSRPVVFLEY